MRHLDAPPVWLLLFGLAAWAVARIDPWRGVLSGAWTGLAAGLLIGGGALLALLAVARLRRADTEVLPRREASSLVTDGIFRLSRNPIYLGMTMILLGWGLRLGSPLALPLALGFAWLIQTRFVLDEEASLRRLFPHSFDAYAARTRRWL